MYCIIGANGYFGAYYIRNIMENTSDHIIAADLNLNGQVDDERIRWVKTDVTKDQEIDALAETLKGHESIKYIYLAAYHKPDLVQKNPRIAWEINIIALAKMLNKLPNAKCLFYASTDSVYGNSIEGHHFVEEDRLNPANLYGIHKKTAEAIVNGYGYNVVRFPFLVGPSLLTSKKHFYDEIAETIKNGETFEMFKDSYRSSIDFNQAARIVIQLIETYKDDYPKILNISSDKDMSKYDVGIMIADREGCNRELIKPISIADANGIFDAPRAASTLLDNTKIKKILGVDQIQIEL